MKKKRSKKARVLYYSRPTPNNIEIEALETQLHEEKLELEKRMLDLERDRHLLEDTIHEIGKINNQIKYTSYRLTKDMDFVEVSDQGLSSRINNTLLTLSANASLLSIRMDSYVMLMNPSFISNEMVAPVGVYAKVEKVYKCLYSTRVEKDINIRLEGQSKGTFRLRSTIEIAFLSFWKTL